MKATSIAPSNIAFIKYWGKKDAALRLPANGSVSMNLSKLLTTTTVEFSEQYDANRIMIDGQENQQEKERVSKFLDHVRKRAGKSLYARVESKNSFPSGTGLSSSASGFAALAHAASTAIGLSLSEKELSMLARRGSGSACRSIPSGFVEWIAGTDDDTSYATSLFPPDHWAIVDVVAQTATEKKDVSTTRGQERADSSPFFSVRLDHIEKKIARIKEYIAVRDFEQFGALVESEALELHAVMLTSTPPLAYLLPETVRVIRAVRAWRTQGLPVYFTLNTGQDVHCICEERNAKEVENRLKTLEGVKQTIINVPCEGARIFDEHLF